MKSDYIAQNDDAFNAQLQTFKNGIASYSAVIGVIAAQIAAQAADAAYFDYTLKCMNIMANGALQWTGWKNLERTGGNPPASGAPVAPVFPAAVPAVAPGIEARFRALVQIIKTSASYNETIGQALGIEGAQQTGPDLTTIQPVIDAVISGNHVNVKWGWGGNSAYLDICEIQVDRGDGKGFVLLAFDTTPGYTDTQPFPAAPVTWTYRAIYRVGDAQVGQWSNPVSVTVPA
ncbi:MAG TPA: hypothetical protein VIK53_05130 [Verrucomicrobiae bacterium]